MATALYFQSISYLDTWMSTIGPTSKVGHHYHLSICHFAMHMHYQQPRNHSPHCDTMPTRDVTAQYLCLHNTWLSLHFIDNRTSTTV